LDKYALSGVISEQVEKGKQTRYKGKYLKSEELKKKTLPSSEDVPEKQGKPEKEGAPRNENVAELEGSEKKEGAAVSTESAAGEPTNAEGAMALAMADGAEATEKKGRRKQTKQSMIKRAIEVMKSAFSNHVDDEPEFLEKKEIRRGWKDDEDNTSRRAALFDMGKTEEELMEEDDDDDKMITPMLVLDAEKTAGSLFHEEIEQLQMENEAGQLYLEVYSDIGPQEQSIESSVIYTPVKAPVPSHDRISAEIFQGTDEAQEIPMSIYDKVLASGKSEIEKYSERMAPTEERSVQLFRHMQEPIYYKHFLAHSYRKSFEKNPYDSQHFLDDKLNPNLGIFYDSMVNPNALKNDLGEVEEVIKVYRSRLGAVNPNSKKVMNTTPHADVSTNPNFIQQHFAPIDHNLHKLRPQEVEELQKPKLHFFGHGARKTSKAVAVVSVPGTGQVKVNNRELIEYFSEPTSCAHVVRPIYAAEKLCEVDIHLYITGGGITGQGLAAQSAVAKALARAYPELYESLHDGYFFYSDNRQVEPKATGRYKARKAYAYVRR
jgi:small subunit ribosomal protein S9